jgi:hypothetical protein
MSVFYGTVNPIGYQISRDCNFDNRTGVKDGNGTHAQSDIGIKLVAQYTKPLRISPEGSCGVDGT